MNPLRQLSLEQLRLRTSMKWATYQDDVLPLWVAEMDVPVAEPVARAIHRAVERGDTGYPAGTAYAEAFADFAARRWDWYELAVERTAIVPDVMLGIVEMLKLVSGHGDPVVVNCPVYPPFYQFIRNDGSTGCRGAADRGRADRPDHPGGRVPEGHRSRRAAGVSAVQSAQSDRHRTHRH